MKDVVVQPFLAGLSTGWFCCAYCFPFVAPLLVAEERTWRETWRALGWLMVGRFFGYALFGLVVGMLSERWSGRVLDVVLRCALVVLSAVLVMYGVGLLRSPSLWCAASAPRRRRTPFLMGLLMGINLCPPFLSSVIYVFTLHSALMGVIYFVMFFLGTTVYFAPLGALGGLTRWPDMRMAARISAVLVGLIFGLYGVYGLFWGGGAMHQP